MDTEIIEAIEAEGLGGKLNLLGYLSHADSVAELRQADIILMPLRRSPEYSKAYPGKIFECIAAAMPAAPGLIRHPAVLGIGPADSAAAQLLRDTGAGEMFDWEDDPSAFIRAAASSSLEISTGTSDAAAFSRRVLTARIAELLGNL